MFTTELASQLQGNSLITFINYVSLYLLKWDKKIEDKDVIVVSLHPGFARSQIMRTTERTSMSKLIEKLNFKNLFNSKMYKFKLEKSW